MKPEDVTDWKEQWKDVEFKDVVQMCSVVRGRSSATFKVYSGKTHNTYTVFLSDFMSMLMNGDIDGRGWIYGTFIVKKKGRNLGIIKKNTPAFKYEYHGESIIPEYI